MKFLIIALCLVISAYAQVPTPCESPKQWESREFMQDYRLKFAEIRRLSYDETNRRIREVEAIEIGSDREFFDRLYLFNENKNYSLNLKTKICTVTTLSRPFIYRGVRPGAHFDFIFNIGAVGVPGESVAVQAWSANLTDGQTVHLQIKEEQKEIIQNVLERKDSMAECYQRASERACVTFPLFVFGQGFYTGLVTYPSCFPVQNIYVSKRDGFFHSQYFDLSIGISDLNVFVPSQECIMAEKKLKNKIHPVL